MGLNNSDSQSAPARQARLADLKAYLARIVCPCAECRMETPLTYHQSSWLF